MSLPSFFHSPSGKGTQEDMEKEPRFNGIPPVGNNPVKNKWVFLGLVLVVFAVKIVIWTGYRWACGNVYPLTVYEVRTWVSVFAKPILQLGPVFLLWWFMFHEKGMPFRFTRKNLLTSVVFGCIMGLVFYLVSSGVFAAQLIARGEGGDFHFVAGWNDSSLSFSVIIALMFTFMLSTGPAEELFSRGFIQDQLSRAYSIPTAIIISALLFAAGHLPISILVYHLDTVTILWYMVVLVIMGGFFSLIYHWSRNILFGSIIHGLWDWYLSLMILKGAYTTNFLLHFQENFGMTDLINTLLTLAITLPMFYLLYRKFWRIEVKREALGEPRHYEGPMARVLRRVRRLDSGLWPEENMGLFSVFPAKLRPGLRKNWWPLMTVFVVTGLFCLAMIPLADVMGTNEPDLQRDRPSDGPWTTIVEISAHEDDTYQGSLMEQDTCDYQLGNSSTNVLNVTLTLDWTDETPTPAYYTNEPDTFELTLYGPDGEQLATETGSDESIEIRWAGEKGEENVGELTARVKLTNAGDMVPPINPGGHLSKEDNSNDYEIRIIYDTVLYREKELPEPKVRW